MNLDEVLADASKLTSGRSYGSILYDTYQLLADPARWTQGAHARTRHGAPVKPRDPTAVCWCLLGGTALYSNLWGIIPGTLLTHLEVERGRIYGTAFESVGQMNDYLSHAGMLDFLRRVLEGR